MNYRYLVNQLGWLLLVFSAFLLGMGLWVAARGAVGLPRDGAAMASLLISGGGGAATSLGLIFFSRQAPRLLGRREALLLVASSWILGAALSALPYFLWAHLAPRVPDAHPFRNFVDCYFESMSGLTTTGASVLGVAPSDIESIPQSLLLWRGLTQWLGGIGIVVLFVAVLPSFGVGGKKLYRVEAGSSKAGLQPQIRETARMLLAIYLGLTAAQTFLLFVAGMTLSEALNHAFTTLATGGFSPRNASLGAYRDEPAVSVIVVAFMILGGANFALYYQLLRGKGLRVLGDLELRLYLICLALGALVVFLSMRHQVIALTSGATVGPSSGVALGEAIFTTVSIQTTTGYVTSDFNRWPWLAQAVLVVLMVVGGCSGSTAGGVKVIRLWVAFRVMLSEIERVFRPHVIRPVKVAGATLSDEVKLGTMAYVLGFVVLLFAGSAAVMLLEDSAGSGCSFTAAFGSSVATLCTIGPGLAGVGATENFGWLSAGSKLVLSLLMVLGRLEIFAIIVLFSPRFWRAD